MCSMPNIDQKFKSIRVENMLFECECNGDHYLEVFFEPDEKDYLLTFAFKDYPESLWSAIKWWWRGNGLWRSELLLTKEDTIKLRDKLNEHLK